MASTADAKHRAVKKTGILRSMGKQSGKSGESVLKKKRKSMVGRVCRKKSRKVVMLEWSLAVDG